MDTTKLNFFAVTERPIAEEEKNRFQEHLSSAYPGTGVQFSKATPDEIYSLLENDVADAILVPLHQMPVLLPKHISIAALSERFPFSESLYITEKSYDDNMDFRIKDGASVAVSVERQKFQLHDLRPDLDIIIGGDKTSADAWIAPSGEETDSHIKSVKLNPREFASEPGFGPYAYLTSSDNVTMRRILKTYHHRDTAALTNIERKLVKLNIDDKLKILGAYCYKGSSNFFHVLATAVYDGDFKKVSISQSIGTGLAEKILESFVSDEA